MDLKSTARAPPPAFLFPNQQCQRPKPPRLSRKRPIRLTPDVGGGGYLSNLEPRVKSFLEETFRLSPLASPEGFRRSRQLLKKSPEPVKRFSQKKEKLFWSEILGSSCEPLCISGRAASNEADFPGQPPFSFLFSWRPRSLQSAKTDRGAPLGSAVSQKGFD